MSDGSNPDELWTMGAVTRHTGLGEHTLRTWERRYGFPSPRRLPSGHRRYDRDQVDRLRLIARVLQSGFRPGDVIRLSMEQLENLISRTARKAPLEPSGDEDSFVSVVIEAVRKYDHDGLAGLLQREANRMGLPRFLRERLTAVLEAIGDAWARGDLDVRHEHFTSRIVDDHLSSERASLRGPLGGAPVVLATLPGERHGLGLAMIGVIVALAGRDVRLLGVDTPVKEIVAAARDLEASVVGISVSPASGGPESREQLAELRGAIPEGTRIWVGGAGAALLDPLPAGVERLEGLDDVEREVRRLPDRGRSA